MNLFGAIVTMCALVAMVPAADAGAKVSSNAALIAKGHTIVQRQCARCHGIAPTDTSPLEQAPPLARIAERYPIEQLAEAFAEGIAVGHNEMPPFELQPREIDALLAYLDSLEKQERARK